MVMVAWQEVAVAFGDGVPGAAAAQLLRRAPRSLRHVQCIGPSTRPNHPVAELVILHSKPLPENLRK